MILSRIAEFLGLWGLHSDLAKCIGVIDNSMDKPVSDDLIQALIIAEDHRNAYHPGIDPIGIVRAVFVRIRLGKVQRASTVEQQFVRTVTNRYEITLRRKIREQMLAIMVARLRRKYQIASAYLLVAHYGHSLTGYKGLKELCGTGLNPPTMQHACEVVSRLKYPEPHHPPPSWGEKISRRAAYISQRLSDKPTVSGHHAYHSSNSPLQFNIT